MLNKKMIAERGDILISEIDTSIWVSLEDIHDGSEKSGQVGQEVYGRVKSVKERHSYLEYSIFGNNWVHVKW